MWYRLWAIKLGSAIARGQTSVKLARKQMKKVALGARIAIWDSVYYDCDGHRRDTYLSLGRSQSSPEFR